MELGNVAQFASAAAAVVAVTVSLLALFTSREALRANFRPAVRPVPLFDPTKHLATTALILKNYGKGPALGVSVFVETGASRDERPIVTVDVVEPLGSGKNEAQRLGRVEVKTTPGTALQIGRRYRLLYQDLAGSFYETQFTVQEGAFAVRFLGRHSDWKLQDRLPRRARDFASVVSPEIPLDL